MNPKPSTSPARPPKKPRTGVTRYDPEFAELICERIATTPQSLVKICEAPDMPGIATIFRWLREHPDFQDMYVLAKETQAEVLLEQALDLVDDASHDILDTIDGKPIFNRLALQRCKMQVEHRRWIASKLLPRKYGSHQRSSQSSPPFEASMPAPIVTPERLKALAERRRKALDAAASPTTSFSAPTTAPSPVSDHPPTSPDNRPANPNPELRSPSSDPQVTPPPLKRPPSGHNPKPWYDVPPPPPRPKSTMNKACS